MTNVFKLNYLPIFTFIIYALRRHSAIRKYKSQSSSAKRSAPGKVKRLNVKTINSFFPAQHNLKLDENIYKCLDNKKTSGKRDKPKEKKVRKPPPLILTDKTFQIGQFITQNYVTKFNIKFLSIGTKVFFENDNDLLKISNALKQANIDFFTYNSKDNKTYKVVLAGLPEVPIELIKEELQSPAQIIQVTLRNPDPHKALYLVHLNGKEYTFQDIQRVKSICHTLKWSKYKPIARNITQCRNCTMYGHGSRNCFRKPVCSQCASNEHTQQNCPLNKLNNDSAPVYKCSYCTSKNLQAVNHRANDANCPGRKAYIDARENASQRQRAKETQSAPGQRKNQNQQWYTPAPNPPPLSRSFKDGVVNNAGEGAANVSCTGNANDDLFTTAELLRIFMKAAGELKNCKSKLDQIQVITNLLSYAV